MIRELKQIQLLLENINGNLVVKKSEEYDFQKKNTKPKTISKGSRTRKNSFKIYQ